MSNEQNLSYIKYIGDGITRDFYFDFKYIKKGDIKVYIDGVQIFDFIFTSDYSIRLNVQLNWGEVMFIKRETVSNEPLVYFSNVSTLNKEDLNLTNEQALYVMQEILDEVNQRLPVGGGDNEILNNLNMNNFRILNLGDAVGDNDAVNLGQVNNMLSGIQAGIEVIEEEFLAEEGQTVFELTKFTYTPGYGTIFVIIDGISQGQKDIEETDTYKITIDEPCNGGERVLVRKNDAPSNSIVIKQASEEILGGALFASPSEALEKENRIKTISPFTLGYVLDRFQVAEATDEKAGSVRLSKDGETGSDSAMTPDTTEAKINESLDSKLVIMNNGALPTNGDGRPDGTIVFTIE